jgi:translocation and assembly module TamB
MAPGLIRFPKTDPNNPELVLSGNTRIMGYDITVRVEGSLVEPVITLSSTPSLSNEDLLLLVMTGKIPSLENASDDSANVSMVALYLGQDLLTRLFGSNMENEDSLLDRLQIDIGRSITQQGEDTIETQFRLMDGVFSPRDSLYITAEKDIWDDYNGGIRLLFKFH